jgi:hypothetical protein
MRRSRGRHVDYFTLRRASFVVYVLDETMTLVVSSASGGPIPAYTLRIEAPLLPSLIASASR